METITITPEDVGKRLDVFLTAHYPAISRSKIQKQIKNGAITVNEKKVTPHFFLEEDHVVSVPEESVQTQPKELKPRPDIKLNIVHEDDSILVIDKPTDFLVHPATGEDDTVANAVLGHFPAIATVGDKPEERPGIVHRLDKDASGLLVIAKTQSAFEHLKNQFKEHEVLKEYAVLVGGHVPEDSGTISLYIGRSSYGGRMAARPQPREGDRDAVTHYQREQTFNSADFLSVRTETGRTHQIRVHLNAIGNPVAGDPVYGARKHNRQPAPRLFLHCRKLELHHPVTGELMSFTSPLPADLQATLKQLK